MGPEPMFGSRIHIDARGTMNGHQCPQLNKHLETNFDEIGLLFKYIQLYLGLSLTNHIRK